jgi:NADP-dependent 3-hydroxy acid dehydrogenase YdfG
MSDTLVLITGASGHLGFRILVSTLEAGHCVMATVRDEEQLEKIARKPSVQPYRNQLTFALVKDKDLTAPRAFEHFMQEVTHVIHNASVNVSPGPRAKKGDKPLVFMPHASQERNRANASCFRPCPNASTTLRARV